MDVGTLNKLVDTVFPQVSTSFTLKEIVNLGSAGITYELAESTGFPFDRDDSTRYHGTSVVIAQGLAENVQQLHEFLYPSETEYTVSNIVQSISVSQAADVLSACNLHLPAYEGVHKSLPADHPDCRFLHH